MFICNVNKNNINVTERETITSGSVNAFECEFVFSDDWDILQSTVSFKAADTVISVMLDNNNRCIIPWEVLAVPDTELYVGVVGYGDMGTEAKEDDITLPTIWAYLGTIVHGANDGEDPTPPTPGVYEQIMIKLADLEANKQDKITGNPGQIVGFDADGNAIAQDDTGGITYTAGDNIHISEDNVISADMYDDTAVKADIAELQTATASNTEAIAKKQNTLIAGDNIHISDSNVISADMYDDTSVKADIAALQTATADNTNKINSNTEAITKKQNTLTAGTNITIENDIISASSYDDSEITADVETLKSTKQDKITGNQGQVVGFDANGNPIAQDDTGGVTYTAGANIHISEDNVISADMYDDTSVKADIAALQTATASNTEAISNKQNTLTAGDNIHISSDNVISADMYDDTNIKADIAALQTATASNAEAISKKQNTLTAGDNIHISDSNVISADMYDDTAVKADIAALQTATASNAEAIAKKQNTLIAGANIHISSGNVISADMYDDTAVKADIAELQTATASNTEAITKKQNTLIAGANITIENNTISAASYDDAEILAEISALDSDKQNKLTGTQNQIVGFDENGNAIAREGGADGYSPTVSIEDVPGGNQVTITDKNGPHSFDVMDGVDGYSPTVSIEETPGGNEITITDKNGAHSFTAIDSVPSYTIAEVSTSSAEEKAYRLKRDGTATGSTIVTRKHGIYYDGIGTTQYVENNAISIAGVVDSYGASVGMSVDKPRANIYFIEEFEDYYVSDFNLYRVKEPANKNSSGAKNIRFSSGANKVTNLYLLIYQTETATYPKCLIHHTYVLEPSGNLDGGYITVTDRSGAQFNVDKLLMQGKIVAGTFVTGYRGYYLALSPLFLSGEKSVAISQGFYALTQL